MHSSYDFESEARHVLRGGYILPAPLHRLQLVHRNQSLHPEKLGG